MIAIVCVDDKGEPVFTREQDTVPRVGEFLAWELINGANSIYLVHRVTHFTKAVHCKVSFVGTEVFK